MTLGRAHRGAVTAVVRLTAVRAAIDALDGPRGRLQDDAPVPALRLDVGDEDWWRNLEDRLLNGDNRVFARRGRPYGGVSVGIAEIDDTVHALWARAPYGRPEVADRIEAIAEGLRDRYQVIVPRPEELAKMSPQRRALLLVEAKIQAQVVLAYQLKRGARLEVDPEQARAMREEAEQWGHVIEEDVELQKQIRADRFPADEARRFLSFAKARGFLFHEKERSLRDVSRWPGIVSDDLPLKRAKAVDVLAKEVGEAHRASLETCQGESPAVAALVSGRLTSAFTQALQHPRVVEAMADPIEWSGEATNDEAIAMLRTTGRWEHADERMSELRSWIAREFDLEDRSRGDLAEERAPAPRERPELGDAVAPSAADYRRAAEILGDGMARARQRALGTARDAPQITRLLENELALESARDLKVAREQAATAGPLRSASDASLAGVLALTRGWRGVDWSDHETAEVQSLADLDRQVESEFGRRLGREQGVGVEF